MNKVEVNPTHMLVLIEALVNEVNDHLQDEQGDWDKTHVNMAYDKIYALLGTTLDEQPHREPTFVGDDKIALSVDGIGKDGRIYGDYRDYRVNDHSRNKWMVFNEETAEWEDVK